MTENEILWKRKFEKLKFKIIDLAERVECRDNDFCPPTERAFVQANRVYVSFDFEVTSNKKFADDNWGEGNYDVYDLNRELSPFDDENVVTTSATT